MRRLLGIAFFMSAWVICATAQQSDLTDQQRIADLDQVSAMFAKNYAPYEWKRDVVGFDLLRLTPWVQRIRHSDDLDFQEALVCKPDDRRRAVHAGVRECDCSARDAALMWWSAPFRSKSIFFLSLTRCLAVCREV